MERTKDNWLKMKNVSFHLGTEDFDEFIDGMGTDEVTYTIQYKGKTWSFKLTDTTTFDHHDSENPDGWYYTEQGTHFNKVYKETK